MAGKIISKRERGELIDDAEAIDRYAANMKVCINQEGREADAAQWAKMIASRASVIAHKILGEVG